MAVVVHKPERNLGRTAQSLFLGGSRNRSVPGTAGWSPVADETDHERQVMSVRKVTDSKVCDTQKAELLHGWDNGSDFHCAEERLYRTVRGAYFGA